MDADLMLPGWLSVLDPQAAPEAKERKEISTRLHHSRLSASLWVKIGTSLAGYQHAAISNSSHKFQDAEHHALLPTQILIAQ